jgi:hypothetical protein
MKAVRQAPLHREIPESCRRIIGSLAARSQAGGAFMPIDAPPARRFTDAPGLMTPEIARRFVQRATGSNWARSCEYIEWWWRS